MRRGKVDWDPPSHFSKVFFILLLASVSLSFSLVSSSLLWVWRNVMQLIPRSVWTARVDFPEGHCHVHCLDPKNLYVWGLDTFAPNSWPLSISWGRMCSGVAHPCCWKRNVWPWIWKEKGQAVLKQHSRLRDTLVLKQKEISISATEAH